VPCAPIALFVHARPHHTRAVLAALRRNHLARESELVVFSDGPKGSDETLAVQAVRDLAHAIDGFGGVSVVERPCNLGLAASIIAGVTDVVETAGQVIVVEDDMLTSPAFLTFMNGGLDRFRDDERVASVHGYLPPLGEPMPEAFFLRGADCWGWATWTRAWSLFRSDGATLLRELEARRLTAAFDCNGSYPFTQMLRDQVAGRNDSWAIRWHASVFLLGGLTLHPGRSLVQNIGLDGSGTHCGTDDRFETTLALEPPSLASVAVEEDLVARAAFERFYRARRPTTLQRLLRKVRSLTGMP